MGRDHTIYAAEAGYVKYYRDPVRHPDRQYIGVVFDKTDRLPSPKNAVTKRRLGMVTIQKRPDEGAVVSVSTEGPTLRPGYMYREGNWQIGRVAERAGVSVKDFDKKDRWLAWRKKMAKIRRIVQMKAAKSRKGGKKNKTKGKR